MQISISTVWLNEKAFVKSPGRLLIGFIIYKCGLLTKIVKEKAGFDRTCFIVYTVRSKVSHIPKFIIYDLIINSLEGVTVRK